MPIDYWVDSANGILVTKVAGRMKDREMVGYMKRLTGDTTWPSGMNGFVDARDLEDFEVTARGFEKARVLGAAGEHRFAGSRWAIVANQDVVFGMTRMYELKMDSQTFEIRVFREPGPALEWLDVEPRPPLGPSPGGNDSADPALGS